MTSGRSTPTTSHVPSSRRELTALTLGGTPEPWAAFGFTVDQGEIHVGGVRLAFDPDAEGVAGWELDGEPGRSDAHANGVTLVDHVVLATHDLAAKVDELAGEGFDHRATRGKQAFFVVGPCLLEVVEADGEGLWGITFTAGDVERHPGVKDAVQPGRRIATVSRDAGLGFPVALISPR
jgi:hypothetical protein